MAEYRLLTIWRIEAPLREVYAAIHNSLRWPEWWPSVRKVEDIADGDRNGINSVRRYAWQGKLPYRVVFDVRATRIESLVAIEGTARGDLEGSGHWNFSRQGTTSIVRYEWHVKSKRWWMNLVAPVARSIFIRNHTQIMQQGGKALARLLKAPLVGQEHIDLMATPAPPAFAGRSGREPGRIDPVLALIVGIGAGVIATVVQLALWRFAEMPVLDTLLRDARLTAAMIMGASVLPPPLTPRWDILAVATLIHFALSFAYALVLMPLARRLGVAQALMVGAVYGLAIYAFNLHGMTLLFPWFVQTRDWVTLATHVVFGAALAVGCRLFDCGSHARLICRSVPGAAPGRSRQGARPRG